MTEERTYNYPEGSAEGFAGYCTELTAWQLLHDVVAQLQEATAAGTPASRGISPSAVMIGPEGFVLAETAPQPVYTAPEGGGTPAADVWSLGATLFRLVMGCDVMNGRGGAGQRPGSTLPYMRSEMPQLSELVMHCLSYDPARRPTLAQLAEEADAQLARCREEVRKGLKHKPLDTGEQAAAQAASDSWPEEMIELK